MPASMYENNFASYRLSAWHRLGKVYETETTVTQALADMKDFPISKYPVMYVKNGETYLIDGQYALVRDTDDSFCFGTCSANYGYLQNSEIAELLDTLGFRMETLGFLGEGETIFCAMHYGESSVLGEDIKSYFLFHDKRNGKTSAQMSIVPVRVVCQNTLSLALNGISASVTIPHSLLIKDEMEFRTSILRIAKESNASIENALKTLGSIQIGDQAEDIVMRVLRMPAIPRTLELASSSNIALQMKAKTAQQQYDSKVKNIQKAQEYVLASYEQINDEYPAIAGTGWSMYNAFTQYTTHAMNKSAKVQGREDIFGKGLDIRSMAYAEIMRG